MIVMKFGGTSVGGAKAMRRVLRIVADRLAFRPVVVVSAVGGITNILLENAQRSRERSSEGIRLLEKFCAIHDGIIRELGLPAGLAEKEYVQLR